eukprot:g16921.t1
MKNVACFFLQGIQLRMVGQRKTELLSLLQQVDEGVEEYQLYRAKAWLRDSAKFYDGGDGLEAYTLRNIVQSFVFDLPRTAWRKRARVVEYFGKLLLGGGSGGAGAGGAGAAPGSGLSPSSLHDSTSTTTKNHRSAAPVGENLGEVEAEDLPAPQPIVVTGLLEQPPAEQDPPSSARTVDSNASSQQSGATTVISNTSTQDDLVSVLSARLEQELTSKHEEQRELLLLQVCLQTYVSVKLRRNSGMPNFCLIFFIGFFLGALLAFQETIGSVIAGESIQETFKDVDVSVMWTREGSA